MPGRKRYRVTEYLPYKVARYVGQVAAYHYGGATGAYAYDKIMPSVGTQTGGGYHSYGNGTLTTERHKYGRKRNKKSWKYVAKIVRANITRRIYGYDAWSQMYGTSGYNRLENYFYTTGSTYYVPCHLYDLTTVINSVSGSVQNPQVGYRLAFDTPAGGQLTWRTLGPTLTTIQSDLSNAVSQMATPLSNDLLTGVKVKMVAYCPTTIPVRFKVALVQITDQKFQPSKNPVATFALNDYGIWQADNTLLPNDQGSSINAAAANWQAQIQQYVRSPCAIGDSNTGRPAVKVLKSVNFVLQPKETTDPSNTTYHALNLYFPMNRKQNYMWQDDALLGMNTDRAVQSNVGLNKCCVHPNARLFLMIMADSKYNSGSAEPVNDPTIWPSYDLAMRFYHEDLK